MRVLVVAAHPDDETLGAGASLARLALEGHEIHCTVLGEGTTSRTPSRGDTNPDLLDQQSSDLIEATSILGIKHVTQFDLPDNRFDGIDLLEIVKLVESAVDAVKPDLVITHSSRDLNFDHRIVHAATLTATRPIGSDSVRTVLAFEVPSSTEWNFSSTERFNPTVFVNVNSTIETKIAALRCYESEMRSFPHPRSEENIRALAANRGATAGYEAAEAFELVRALH